MTTQELADLLANMQPAQFERLVMIAPELAAKKDPDAKPPLPRRTIYIPPNGASLEVWSVDYAPWKAAGALDQPPTAEDLERWNPKPAPKQPAKPAVAAPAEAKDEDAGEADTRTKAELRAAWKAQNPDAFVPPRATRQWFLDRLTEETP